MPTRLRPVASSPSASEPAAQPPREPFFRDPDDLVTIYQADCTDLSFLKPDSVQLIVTSPPYNLGKDYGTARDDATYHQYLDWVVTWARQLWRVLEPGGRLCLNIPLDINLSFDEGRKRVTRKSPVLADFTHRLVNEEEGWLYNTTILWLEGNISRRTAWGSWLKASDPWVNTAAEAVLVLSKQKRKRDGRGKHTEISREEFMDWTLGLWEFRGENSKRWGHPAAFPEELPRRLIRMFSFTDDVILDPFLGSGTTCRVAKDEGRKSIGIEINAEYCKTAAERCRTGPPPAPEPAVVRLARGVLPKPEDEYLLGRLDWATSKLRTTRPRGRSGR